MARHRKTRRPIRKNHSTIQEILAGQGEVDAEAGVILGKDEEVILELLVERETPSTSSELAHALKRPRLTLEPRLKALARKGLVVSERESKTPGAKRVNVWRATGKGADALTLHRHEQSISRHEDYDPESFVDDGALDFDPFSFGGEGGEEGERFVVEVEHEGPFLTVSAYDREHPARPLVGYIRVAESREDVREDRFDGDFAPVVAVWIAPLYYTPKLEAQLYERAALEAREGLGVQLASAAQRSRKQSRFWQRQKRRGRATRERVRPHGAAPGGSRFFMDPGPVPDAETLANPGGSLFGPPPEADPWGAGFGGGGPITPAPTSPELPNATPGARGPVRRVVDPWAAGFGLQSAPELAQPELEALRRHALQAFSDLSEALDYIEHREAKGGRFPKAAAKRFIGSAAAHLQAGLRL